MTWWCKVSLEARHGVIEGAEDWQGKSRQRGGPALLHVDEHTFPFMFAEPPNYLLRAALQELLFCQGIEPRQSRHKVGGPEMPVLAVLREGPVAMAGHAPPDLGLASEAMWKRVWAHTRSI